MGWRKPQAIHFYYVDFQISQKLTSTEALTVFTGQLVLIKTLMGSKVHAPITQVQFDL